MRHNDVTRTVTTTTETWMQLKKQGQMVFSGQEGRRLCFTLDLCTLKKSKTTPDWVPQWIFNFAHDAKGRADSIFLTNLRSESWSIRSPHPNKVEGGNSSWWHYLHESSQGPTPSLYVFNLMHMLSVQRCFRVQFNKIDLPRHKGKLCFSTHLKSSYGQ